MVYLIPYLTTVRRKAATPSLPSLYQHWLFLERNGTHLMEIPEEALTSSTPLDVAASFLQENELIAAAPPFQVSDYVFAPVDRESKDLSAFYSWSETPAGTTPSKEAWRGFLWLATEKDSDPWSVNRLLEEVTLGPAPHTAFQVLQALETHLKAAHPISIDGGVNPKQDSSAFNHPGCECECD